MHKIKQVDAHAGCNATFLKPLNKTNPEVMIFLDKQDSKHTERRRLLCLSATVPALISLTGTLGAGLMIPYMYILVPILVVKFGYKLEETQVVAGNSNKSSSDCRVSTDADSSSKANGVLSHAKAENPKNTCRSSAGLDSFSDAKTIKIESCSERERTFTLGNTTYTESQLRSIGIKLYFVFMVSGFCIALIKDSMFSNLSIALPFLGIHLYCFIKNMPLSVISGYFKVLSWSGVGGFESNTEHQSICENLTTIHFKDPSRKYI